MSLRDTRLFVGERRIQDPLIHHVQCGSQFPDGRVTGAKPWARTARLSGDNCERAILATAQRLLEQRPLADISVDDLAKGAGICRPTVYFYSPSKDAVLFTLLEQMIADADATLENLNDRNNTPR